MTQRLPDCFQPVGVIALSQQSPSTGWLIVNRKV